MPLLPVVNEDELWIGEMGSYRIGGKRILIARTEDGVHACEDRCPHLGLPLSAGTLRGAVLTCGAHGYSFDIRTGQGVNPRSLCLRRLPARIVQGAICVELEASSSPPGSGVSGEGT